MTSEEGNFMDSDMMRDTILLTLLTDFVFKWGIELKTKQKILVADRGLNIFTGQLQSMDSRHKSLTVINPDYFKYINTDKIEKTDGYDSINSDFYSYCCYTDERFDLIIGLPPYLIFEDTHTKEKVAAMAILETYGLISPGLDINPWISFIVGSSLLLKEKGKIGLLLPTALLYSAEAAPIRKFLCSFYNKVLLFTFKTFRLSAALGETVLLLCERDKSNTIAMKHLELNNEVHLHKLLFLKFNYFFRETDFYSDTLNREDWL